MAAEALLLETSDIISSETTYFCVRVKLQVRNLTTSPSCCGVGCAQFTLRFLTSPFDQKQVYWYGRNPINAQHMSPQFFSIISSYFTQRTWRSPQPPFTLYPLQCSSTNPSSLSSAPSFWPLASAPRQQGNQAIPTTKYRAITTIKCRAIITTKQTKTTKTPPKAPPIQHRLVLRPLVPPFAAGTPTCCDSEQSFSSLSPAFQAALKALDSNLNPDLPVGVNCDAAGTQTW